MIKLQKEKNMLKNKKIDSKFIFMLALFIICASFLTISIVKSNMEKMRIAKLEALHYGGEIPEEFKPKWQKLPDKTLEFHDDLVADLRKDFPDVIVERVEDIKDEYVYNLKVSADTDGDFFREKLVETYIKYRDKGYKGGFYIYIGDKCQNFAPYRV